MIAQSFGLTRGAEGEQYVFSTSTLHATDESFNYLFMAVLNLESLVIRSH